MVSNRSVHFQLLAPSVQAHTSKTTLLRRSMTEQKADALPIMRPATGLRQRGAHINGLKPVTNLLLLLMRHRVRDHDPAQFTPVQGLDRVAAQDAVRDDGDHFGRAVRHDRVRGFHQRAARVRHVVDEDGVAVAHVADEHHPGHFARAGALFVDQREGQVEAVGHGGCSVDIAPQLLAFLFPAPFPPSLSTLIELMIRDLPLRPARVGADNDTFLHLEILPDPPQRAGFRVQVVHGDVEEALDLARVQVHRDHVVAPGRLQHVGHQFGRDGGPRSVLFVLPRVGEVGDHGRDASGRGGFAGVDDDQQLHQPVVDVPWRCRLKDENWIVQGQAGTD